MLVWVVLISQWLEGTWLGLIILVILVCVLICTQDVCACECVSGFKNVSTKIKN